MFVIRTTAVTALACVALLALSALPAGASTLGQQTVDVHRAADPQAQYYSSYGEPEPLSVPESPAPSDNTPGLAIALSVAALLAIVAGVVAIRLRLHRVRRHAPQVAA